MLGVTVKDDVVEKLTVVFLSFDFFTVAIIVELKIVQDSYPISNSKDVLSYKIQDLGLLDNNPPNENLMTFFDKFNVLIMQWNEEEKNKQERLIFQLKYKMKIL